MNRTRLMVAGLLVLGAACSSDSTSGTGTTLDDTAISADIATVAADGFAEDVDVMSGMDGNVGNLSASFQGAALMGPNGWRPGLTGCTFASGSFTCPDTLKNGLHVTRVVTLKDSTGNSQSAYDSLTTASIHIVADISGDITQGNWSATVARHRDITITGLQGTETSRTVNGTGHETVSRSRVARNDSTRSYDITASSTITNVVMPVRSSDGGNGWPTSGTITRTVTATLTSGPNSGRTVTRTVTITFNGTSTPSGVVNGQPFTFDLSNRTATRH